MPRLPLLLLLAMGRRLAALVQVPKPIGPSSDPAECNYTSGRAKKCDSRARCGYTAIPSLCPQGADHWTRRELLAAIPKFAQVYKRRPEYFSVNWNGMDASHAFTLWFTVTHIKPEWIIESGVNEGFGTWLLRQAAPHAHIVSLDPNARQPEYTDGSSRTDYYLGADFTDFGLMDWHQLIPAESRERTLVVLDDHMSTLRRLNETLRFGFAHLWVDDNEHENSYSLNKMCSPPVSDYVMVYDHFNKFEGFLTLSEHKANLDFVNKHMEVYFEFPALIDRCWTAVLRGTGLLKSEAELLHQGLPPVANETYMYAHSFPPYVKLRI